MDSIAKKIRDLNQTVTIEARDLLRRINSSGLSDSQLPVDISIWIDSITGQFLPLMPTEHPDYKVVDEIRNRYANNKSILLPSASSDIRAVLKNWAIACDCINCTENASPEDIPPGILTSIYYEELKQSVDYITTDFVNKLKGKENGKTHRTAMLHIYGRIYLWAQSMVKLDNIEDCFALAGSLRAILELYVDINLMANSGDLNDVEKYFSFEQVEKWNKAKQVVKLRSEFNLTAPGELRPIDKYLAEPDNAEDKIKAIRTKLWGKDRNENPINPHDWANKPLINRVKDLKNIDIINLYILSYPYCNFLVHSTYYDAINNANNVHLFNYNCYCLSSKMLINATNMINSKIQVIPKEELDIRLDKIGREAFKKLFGEMVKVGRNK
jgi:hypothetical protein